MTTTETTAQPGSLYDFWVPSFEVRLGGRDLDRQVLHDVISVNYTDSLEALDSCELVLNNWGGDTRDFRYVGRREGPPPAQFDPGTGLELWIGYHDRGGMQLVLRGEVVSLAPDFPAGGQPTVTIRALNSLYRLHLKQATRVFEHRTDSQIAQEVVDTLAADMAARGGGRLVLETSPTNRQIEEVHEYVALAGEYPIVFLLDRARHNGYDLYLEEAEGESKLHFHPPEDRQAPLYELTVGRTLLSFSPTLATKEQVAKVRVRGWDPVAKEAFEEEATWDELDNRGLLQVAELSAADSALAGSEILITDEPVFSRQEAKQKAKDHLTDLAHGLVTATGETVGIPELRAGRPVHIAGIGAPFAGRYLLTATQHALGDSGYTTRWEARLEEPAR